MEIKIEVTINMVNHEVDVQIINPTGIADAVLVKPITETVIKTMSAVYEAAGK